MQLDPLDFACSRQKRRSSAHRTARRPTRASDGLTVGSRCPPLAIMAARRSRTEDPAATLSLVRPCPLHRARPGCDGERTLFARATRLSRRAALRPPAPIPGEKTLSLANTARTRSHAPLALLPCDLGRGFGLGRLQTDGRRAGLAKTASAIEPAGGWHCPRAGQPRATSRGGSESSRRPRPQPRPPPLHPAIPTHTSSCSHGKEPVQAVARAAVRPPEEHLLSVAPFRPASPAPRGLRGRASSRPPGPDLAPARRPARPQGMRRACCGRVRRMPCGQPALQPGRWSPGRSARGGDGRQDVISSDGRQAAS